MRLNFIHRFFADTEIGAKLTLDAGTATKTMKEFKKEVKDAETELLNMQAQFGNTSKQALDAAKKVAILKDNIKDASETAKLFDPGNKFQVLGNSIRGLVGGFTALQGVLALAGVEGEELQKTLLKVQGALALTEGLNVIADVTKDFKRLGSVLVQTLGKSGMIGLAIGGVLALVAVFDQLFNKTKDQTLAQQQMTEAMEEATKVANKERAELNLLYNVASDVTKSIKERLSAVANLQEKFPGYFKDIKTEHDLNNNLADAYKNATAGIIQKAKASALYSKVLQNENEILEINDKLEKNRQLKLKAVREGNDLPQYIASIDGGTKNLIERQKELTKANEELSKSLVVPEVKPGSGGAGAGSGTTKAETKEQRDARLAKAARDEQLYWEQRYRDQYNSIQFDAERKRIEDAKANRDEETAQEIADRQYMADQMAGIESYTTKFNAEQSAIRIADIEAEKSARLAAAQAIGNALGALAELIGKQTAAGKALAIAQAVINTWLGVTEIIKTKSVLPEPMATISRIANIVAIVAAGLNAVKNIAKANVPGSSSGGAGSGSAAPIQPQVPAATSTSLDQNSINQIGNAAHRVFVLEADVTNNQERARRLNRAARI